MVTTKASKVQLIFSPHALDEGTLNYFGPAAAVSSPIKIGPEIKSRSRGPAKIVGPITQVPPLPPLSMGKKTKKPKSEGKIKALVVNLELLLKYLKNFKVEQIELWISGAAETEGLLKLAIAAKGEGGVKVVLKPLE